MRDYRDTDSPEREFNEARNRHPSASGLLLSSLIIETVERDAAAGLLLGHVGESTPRG